MWMAGWSRVRFDSCKGTARIAEALAGKATVGVVCFDNIFQERVTDLFANYRKKWRNPSTHEHLETFTEAEAF